jgi:hypothetical protein
MFERELAIPPLQESDTVDSDTRTLSSLEQLP